jgi:carboxyl-terminal processing protease
MSRLAGLLVLVVCAAAQTVSPTLRQSNLDSFEQVWKTVRDKHWDPKLNGVDWQAIHDELKPKVEDAKTMAEARGAIAAMLERLGQTHFGIVPSDIYSDVDADEAGEATPGIDVRVIDGRVLVTAVDVGSPAAARGIRPGWEIVRIGGKELAPVLERIRGQYRNSTMLEIRLTRTAMLRLQGATGSKVHLDLFDGDAKAVALDVERAAPRGKLVRFGNMPPQHVWSEWRKARPEVGYVRFNEFLDPESVAKTVADAVKGCEGCKGFVIDLRGNPGGLGALAMGVAGWFVDRSGLQLGTMYLRASNLKFVIFPRPQPFRGPLAVLVDGCSASTSEILAGGLKDVGRASVFGTRTAGAALPSVFEKLPNGDGFQYAIANYISQGGKPLEGIGVIPDHEARLTREGLLHGRDEVLDAAAVWIQKQK